MLSNRLISILSVCSIAVSCSSHKNKSVVPKVAMDTDCKETNVLQIEKHLVIAAKNQKQKNLVSCFKNYLKFEKNKQQKLMTCSQINIKRSGRVSFVKTISTDNRKIPKDFKWCMEQEFWRMDFAGLQLDRDYQIMFPLNFSSIQ